MPAGSPAGTSQRRNSPSGARYAHGTGLRRTWMEHPTGGMASSEIPPGKPFNPRSAAGDSWDELGLKLAGMDDKEASQHPEPNREVDEHWH